MSSNLLPDHRQTNVVVQQLAIGSYRQAFLDELAVKAANRGMCMTILSGSSHFDSTTLTRVRSPLVETSERNIYVLRRNLVFQRTVAARAIAADIAVLEFNPRIVSNWAILVLRRFLGRPTILWGHAWSRSGQGSSTEWARRSMRRLSSEVVVYTQQSADELLATKPSHRVGVVPNSLFHADEISPACGDGDSVAFIGRLVKAKKPDLLVRSYAQARSLRPEIGPLIMAGDGDLTDLLRSLAQELGIAAWVEFPGWMSEHSEIRTVFERSFCAVSPGYVGLSATQTAGFGLPLIFGRDEPHAPEVVLLDSTNSIGVKSDDVMALAAALVASFDDREKWRTRRASISSRVRDEFSVERMTDGFIDALSRASND